MKSEMIAPCGMNCELCIAYLGKKNDIKNRDLIVSTVTAVA